MAHRNMVPLPTPISKRNPNSIGSPLPVPLSSLTGVEASNFYWNAYQGKLSFHENIGPEGRKATVLVENPIQASTLSKNGCFGLLVENNDWQDKARVLFDDWSPGDDFKV